tara:strand:- start:20 stop:202 length:183 start_codon:yes stop_codon:yes gene_type:complete
MKTKKPKYAATKILNHFREHNIFMLSWTQLNILNKQMKDLQHMIDVARDIQAEKTYNTKN